MKTVLILASIFVSQISFAGPIRGLENTVLDFYGSTFTSPFEPLTELNSPEVPSALRIVVDGNKGIAAVMSLDAGSETTLCKSADIQYESAQTVVVQCGNFSFVVPDAAIFSGRTHWIPASYQSANGKTKNFWVAGMVPRPKF